VVDTQRLRKVLELMVWKEGVAVGATRAKVNFTPRDVTSTDLLACERREHEAHRRRENRVRDH